MPIQAYVLGEPTLIKRADGWYVEVYNGEGIGSTGPMSEEKARQILNEVQTELRAWDANEIRTGKGQ